MVLKSTPKSEAPNLAREIHHHRQLHHPHIAQLYEVIITENKVWLVLELCSNGELYEYLLAQHQLSVEETQSIFGQVCGAVSYIHSKGIVHRDLKLENIFLDRKNNAKLGDFGFTRENDKPLLSTWCGSLSYCAPEVVRGDKYQGEAVDVWSLGVILFALLSGHLPFDDDVDSVTTQMILNNKPVYPTSFSSAVIDLLDKMLNKDPEQRPTASEVLNHPFLALQRQIQLDHLDQPYNPTFQTRMERTVLERLGVAGIDIQKVMTNVLDYRCDSLCGWWWLALQREKRRERRVKDHAKRKSVDITNELSAAEVRISRRRSRSRSASGSADLRVSSNNLPGMVGYKFPSLGGSPQNNTSSQVSPNQSVTNLTTNSTTENGDSSFKLKSAISRPSLLSLAPGSAKRYQSEPDTLLHNTLSTTPDRLERPLTESAERNKDLQNRKHGIMQTFKHWWAEQIKSSKSSDSLSSVQTSPVVYRKIAPIKSEFTLPIPRPTLSPTRERAPAFATPRPTYRRRRSSQLSASSRGSAGGRPTSARQRSNPNLQIVPPSSNFRPSLRSASPAQSTSSNNNLDSTRPPMQRTMSASSNQSSVASYRGSGQAGHSKASSTSSNSTFASTRSIRAPRNPLKVMPATPPPFMIAHEGGYRERNIFESSLGSFHHSSNASSSHGSVAFASRKKSAKRGVLLQTQQKKSRRRISLNEADLIEEEEEGEEGDAEGAGGGVGGLGDGDGFVDVEEPLADGFIEGQVGTDNGNGPSVVVMRSGSLRDLVEEGEDGAAEEVYDLRKPLSRVTIEE